MYAIRYTGRDECEPETDTYYGPYETLDLCIEAFSLLLVQKRDEFVDEDEENFLERHANNFPYDKETMSYTDSDVMDGTYITKEKAIEIFRTKGIYKPEYNSSFILVKFSPTVL